MRLYRDGVWDYEDLERREGYSVVLFGAHGVEYRHPDAQLVETIRRRPGIASVQITFHADKPVWAHAMPPGGFRLAIVNCWDLEAGLAARQEFALALWSAQKLIGPRRRRRARN